MKGTRFVWKIENFSCFDNGTLESPSFSSYLRTWEVVVCKFPVKNYTFKLRSSEDYLGDCYYSVAFLDFEGTPLLWLESRHNKGLLTGCSIGEDQFRRMKDKYLPNGTLTVECRIWLTDDDLIPAWSCFARTRVEPLSEVTEKTFTLNTFDVTSRLSHLSNECEHSVTSRGDTVKVLMFFNCKQEFQAQITLTLVQTFSTCKISLLDVTGKRIQFAEGEFDFDTKGKKWLLPTQITRSMLTINQHKFLPNDTLTLVFDFTFSCKVTFNRSVGENEMHLTIPQSPITYNLTSAEPESSKLNENSNEIEPSNKSDQPVTIYKVLQSMFEEGFMSDFSLRAGDKTFPVHKAVLGTRSPVFKAMFTADMKEKERGSVDISDVDADTVQRMLKFMYCDTVQEDMEWESASSLYAAADKYALEPLKQKCSDILKSELRTSSALGVLVLGVTYQDRNLETAALEFIAKNDKLIIGTESWCKFEEDNPQIAIDILRKLYIKKMKG